MKNTRRRGLFIGLLLAAPTAAIAGVSVQGVSVQGVSVQGVSVQGVSVQGVSVQGVSVQGVSVQGVSVQGVSVQGVSVQGVSVQGVSVQGVSVQGVSVQGVSVQGVSVQGTDLVGAEYKGVNMTSVDVRGTEGTSVTKVPHVLTNVPTMSAGPGNYISVGGGSAVGHYAVAHMVDAHGGPADDLELYIAAEQKDPMPNLFHRAEEQDNQDELYVVYFFHKWSGEWMSLCPYNPATESASAMAIPEDAGDPNKFVFACTATGVAAKCARNWGYRPWAQGTTYVFNPEADAGAGAWELQTFKLRDYYNVCKNAAQASYCQDGRSYTKNGTQVDLFDLQQLIWPNSIENPWSASNDDSLWMMAQEYFISTEDDPAFPSIKASALQRSRYRELSPVSECDNIAYIGRLEHDHIEDGRWATSGSANLTRLQVFSPNYCTHDEDTEGDALPWDCSPCTTQVCKTMPGCCGAGLTPGWKTACKLQAAAVCQSGGVRWPLGKVWPKNAPTGDKSIYPTYLLGPAGAVLRADGVSGSSTSATISGWACDPEWAGGTVALRVYGGAPREEGGTLLGEIRADQPLASPLAREVSAACDGPGRNYARHGFSFTLPANQAGNVFVYAMDESTVNGPAAPPTLVRNGIVHVPRCSHGEHVTGEALSATCSTCAASVCNDGSHSDCCSVAWTDECAAAADGCTAGDSSAPVNNRSFASITTGWLEAPTTGSYTFEASQQPSRLFINGTKVLDWFETSPGTTSGTIALTAGTKYHLRWDRFQAEPPSGTPGPGLTWQPPLTAGQVPIPTDNLYAIAPGVGSGLTATYYMNDDLTGAQVTRKDANVDINHDIAPPGVTALALPAGYGPSYSAVWEGEIVPSFTEDYSFYVVGSGTPKLYIDGTEVTFPATTSSAPGGCAHDLCEPGAKLDASCNSCVQAICAKDDYCCNGGYLSYYSAEPVWDAKCIAEVEKYCPPAKCAPPAPPSGVSPQKKSATRSLQAGVHHAIRLEYRNPSSDTTVRFQWASATQAKQVVPAFALYPRDAVAANVGAGLNVIYFGTTRNGTVKPDLSAAVGAGLVSDFSLTPAVGPLGMPLVNVLASPVDAASGKPSPPTIVRPRYDEEVFVGGGETVHVSGMGAISSGYVHITVEGGAGDVTVPVGPTGDFEANVPVTVGPHSLKIVQQTYAALPCVAPLCTESYDVHWPITVTPATAPLKAPEILTPTDPTHSAVAAPLTLNVVGSGSTGPVHVVDQGSVPNVFPDILPDANGKFSAQITLDNGTTADPNKGWHKLVFDQGGPASHPVFVSVGIDPPKVVFPRNGAEIDCEQPDPQGEQIAVGTLPYPQEQFGRLRVMEETGRVPLAFVGAETTIAQTPPGQPIVFVTRFNPGPGRHVVYFFQAPDPPAQATQDEIDAHFRAYARLADTPTSRIVVERKPPRFPIPQGLAGFVGGRGGNGGIFTNLPPPGQAGPLVLGASNCGVNATPPASILCALPGADVNVRVNGRLYTQRADDEGKWALSIPLPVGWNHLTLAQVSDSRVGGAWSESCLSNEIDVGVQSPGAPIITVPPDITVDAVGPKGTQVFYPDVTAVRATDGASVPVECTPASGSIFGVGRNEVLCTASDPSTGAIGLAELAITVVDGPPTIQVSDLVLEADQPAGTELATYPVLVSDAVDTDLMLECVPPAPNIFLLDEVTPVICEVTDHTNQKATGQFTVKVVDTTPPTLCPLSDIMIGTNAGAGAIVMYASCADDIVDGPIAPSCDRPSGSFFPFGKTVVTCTATDKHGNRSADTFTVSVGDTTPPVLKLPNVVTAFATSKNGAKVNYTVTATDNVDPNPKVKCTPPSGSQFPLGKTPVTCTATDASGNASQGTFIVKVIVNWSGLLPPIPTDGSGVFKQGSTIPTMFTLVDPSGAICDLVARLFVAPVDAAGKVGPEKPAKSRPPGSGNTFAITGHDYHLNLDTGPMAAGRWQLRVDLGDGEPHPTLITLR
jgi:hypothetical protein